MNFQISANQHTVSNMKKHANVQYSMGVATWICEEWSDVHASQESFYMLMSQARRFPPFVFNAPSIFQISSLANSAAFMRFCKNVLVDVCVQECSVHTYCNREVIAVMMTILLYELLADIAFSEMRGRWCQHVSVCWSSIMIEVHQNQPGLHAAVLLTVRPSCLDHAMSSSKVSHHCRVTPTSCSATNFFCRQRFTSLRCIPSKN